MRFRKRWLLLILAVLAALPGFPPLIQWGLEQALAGIPGQISWRRVSGYALTGLRFEGVEASGPGYRASIEELKLGYNLLALAGGKLPLDIELKGGVVRLEPEKLGAGGGGGGGAAVEPVLQRLVLQNVRVESAAWPALALPEYRLEIDGSLPRFDWRLETADGRLGGRLEFKAPDDWRTTYEGDVAVSRFWWDGRQSGRLSGWFGYRNGHWLGEAELSDGAVVLAGFPIEQVNGSLSYRDHVITTELKGRSLGGPVSGSGVVDIPGASYRFEASGRPQLEELMRLWNVNLPAGGSGPLKISGHGWETLYLEGSFDGEGRFLERPLAYDGSFVFDGSRFSLDAAARSSFLDRAWSADFAWRDGGWRAEASDDKGSRLEATGAGLSYAGAGRLVWPAPLQGTAAVTFSGVGERWRVDVFSPGVDLVGVREPLDLSGRLEGAGMEVGGKLGPLALAGRWDDLSLELHPLRLVVGQVSGHGWWRGSFGFEASYDSPYASFPISVRQQGDVWSGSIGDHGGFEWRDGRFTLRVAGLPLQLAGGLTLSGGAVWDGEHGWSGEQTLEGKYLSLRGRLQGSSLAYRGSLLTPLGNLPLAGVADGRGVRGRLDRADYEYAGGRLSLDGLVELGDLYYRGRLAWSPAGWDGRAELGSPWLQAWLSGEPDGLHARTDGYLRGEGRVWPEPDFAGELNLPEPGGLKAARLPVRVEGLTARIGDGRLELVAPYRFSLRLPLSYRGYNAVLAASGDLSGGRLDLLGSWGALSAAGPWREMEVNGDLRLPELGRARVGGRLDLPALQYRLRAELPDADGSGLVTGRAADLEWQLSLQDGAARLAGTLRKARVELAGFESAAYGLAGEWNGELVYDGGLRGEVSYEGPYGRLKASGYGTLRLSGGGPGYELGGYLNKDSLHAALRLDTALAAGEVRLDGPWSSLEALGEGVWRVPGAAPQTWKLLARLPEGSWALSGPLALEGSGLRYQGEINWNAPVYGRSLVVKGGFEGDGLAFSGRGRAELAGLPVDFSFDHGREWSASLAGEPGEVTLRGERLRVRLDELGPLGEALGFGLGGSLAGELRLREKRGSLAGTLLVAGERLGVVLRPQGGHWRLSLYDGARGAGLAAGSGPRPYLEGLGAVSGRLELGEEWSGSLAYHDGDLAARLELTPEHQAALELETPAERARLRYSDGAVTARLEGALSGEGELAVADWSYRLRLRHASRYDEAYLAISGVKDRWQGRGFLVSYRGLPQAGPLSLEGRGLDWSLSWAAPLGLRAAGSGREVLSLRLFGASRLGDAGASWGRVRSDLEYRDGAYRGGLVAGGEGWRLRIDGEGGRARLDGELFGFDAGGYLDASGRLALSISGERGLGPGRLRVGGRVEGSLLAPRAKIEYALAGSGGEELAGSFVYDRGWRLSLQGEGLEVAAGDGRARVEAGGLDLAPYTGLPLKLEASGSGPLETLRLRLRLYDRTGQTDMKGWLRPAALEGELKGALLGGAAEISGAGGEWRLRLDHPRASGVVEYRRGELSGGLALDLPVAGGGLRGRFDAAGLRLTLAGYGSYEGELELGLRPLALRANLRGPGFALESNLTRLSSGWVGDLSLDLPGWGGVRLRGAGRELLLGGAGGLEPLRGRVSEGPWRFSWSYRGRLPRGLGELDAGGELPGEWLRGVWRYAGQEWRLSGAGGELAAETEGARLRARAGGLEAELEGLRLAGLSLSGHVGGSWSELELDLTAAGLRVSGNLGERTRLEFAGWMRGELARQSGEWSGTLRLEGGELSAGGAGPLPELRGVWRGHRLGLAYPRLAVDGLLLDLEERSAEGELRLGGLRLIGEGATLAAVYPLPDGRLTATLDLQGLRLVVNPDGAGDGELEYAPGSGFAGRMTLQTPWGGVTASGHGGLGLEWRHPATSWLPWKQGRLTAELGDGWRLVYRGGEALELSLTPAPGGMRLALRSDWGGGELVYREGWRGRVDLSGFPIAPLEAGLDASVVAEAGALAASGELAGRAGRLSYSLRADAASLLPQLENAALVVENMRIERLPSLLNKLPYASGNVSATFAYGNGMLAGRLVSEGLTVGSETHPVEAALYWSGERKTLEASLGDSSVAGEWSGDDVYLQADLVRLPLHYLTGAWAGPLEGVAYWTGAARAHLRLDELQKSYAVAVGQRLEFTGGGDSLTGSAAARYENGVFYLDELDLSGKGSWRGRGYWGPEDADLSVDIENTVFTPVLRIFPQLRRYQPAAAGSLSLRARGRSAALNVNDLSFSLAGVSGVVPELRVEADGGRLQTEGRVELQKPYPGGFSLKGAGDADDLTLRLEGGLELPAVGELQNVSGTLHWPDWRLDLRAQKASLSGTLRPLSLRLAGELPVSLPEKYLQSGLIRSDLTLTFQDGEYVLGGQAEVVRAVLSRPEGKREVAFEEKKYTYPLRFDRVRIFSNGGIIIQEPLAKGEGEGEVYLGGDLADPYLSGEVRAIRGDFLLGRNRFLVDEGWARFSPVGGLYPEIYLLAHADVRSEEGELKLYLETTGRFVRERGRARLVLEPRIWALENGEPAPYTQEQLLAMLALGGGNLAQGAADLAIQNLLIAQLEYELSKALGLDIFTLDTDLFGGGDIGQTQFTIGKYLSPDLLLTYSVSFEGSQAVGAEYRIDGLRLRVESEIGGDNLEPLVRFSLLYAVRPDLDLIFKLQTGALYLGLEWRF